MCSCDRVQEKAKKFIHECYALQEDTIFPRVLRDEILRTAKTAESIRPNFTACRLINMNRRTIGTLFTALMTYLVVIIQFIRE